MDSLPAASPPVKLDQYSLCPSCGSTNIYITSVLASRLSLVTGEGQSSVYLELRVPGEDKEETDPVLQISIEILFQGPFPLNPSWTLSLHPAHLLSSSMTWDTEVFDVMFSPDLCL